MPRYPTLLATLLSLVAPPVAADVWSYGEIECNQLWFMRNLIMDRAGYCFGSPLGQSLYDNGDCIGKEVALGRAESRQVGRIQALEREIGCKVNTRQSWLDLPMMQQYRRLSDMPLPDNGSSACLQWIGQPVPLLSGYRQGAVQLDTISPGDGFSFGYISEGDWVAVVVGKGGIEGRPVLGWVNFGRVDLEYSCTAWAG